MSESKSNNFLFWLLIIFFLFSSAICIYRDIKNLKDGYTCDLRKRIVGARYMDKNLSIYFYKWKQGDSEILANPFETSSNFKPNTATLSPSLTWLLIPLSRLSFPTIEKIWFVFQYLSFFTIFFLFFLTTKNISSKMLITFGSVLFLFSRGWIFNVDGGQTYMLFALLCTILYFGLNKSSNKMLLTGFFIAIICWLRPLCVFYAIPFLFANENKKFILGLVSGGFVCLIQIFFFNHLHHWIEYFDSTRTWLSYFESGTPNYNIYPDSISTPKIIETQSDFSITNLMDYVSNIPILLKANFHVIIHSNVYLSFIIILCSTLIFFARKQKQFSDYTNLWLLGFICYYIAEIFIWVPKPSYYFVELLFPLLLILQNYYKYKKYVIITLFLGLLLSTFFYKIILMQLLMSEYLIVVSIFFIFTGGTKRIFADNAR